MPREPRNIGASVRARLLDRARAERSDFQILLTRYALERLLYRLSVSPHRDRFILKGAMLFVTWVADPFRPTRDLDLLGHIPVGLTDEFAEAWAPQWRAFLGRDRMVAAPDAFAIIITDLRAFLMPLVVELNEERTWPPSGPWSTGALMDRQKRGGV
jgi:hypothetical protein